MDKCRHPNSEVVMYDLKKNLAYLICPDCNQDYTRQMNFKESIKERREELRRNKRPELQHLN